MPIFRNVAGRLKKLSMLKLDKEKNLQQLIEENLMEVLELRFLATEYVTTFGGRIDTLAVDTDGAPVIIEYKRNKNDSVINQALSYLKWLKTQKPGFFEKLMIDKLGKELADKIKLDWHNPRVICIAESYSKFDIDTVEVVPLRIELLKYRYYTDNIFSLEPVTVAVDELPAPAPQSQAVKAKQEEMAGNAPTLDALLSKTGLPIRELFSLLRERILSIDEGVIEKPTTYYVAYRTSNNFAEIHIQKGKLRIHLRPVDYDDPAGLIEKIPDGYNWTMNRRVYMDGSSDFEYVMGLIEQSYKDVL